MAKTTIQNYTFNAVNKTITFNDYASIRLESLLLITNVTRGIVIYAFNDPAKIGSVNNNVLTLSFDTTLQNNNDKLQIFFEDYNTQPRTSFFAPILFERSVSTFIDTTNYHDCCEFLTNTAGQQIYIPVTTSDTLQVVSTSTSDTAVGVGVRSVGIIYNDIAGNWAETVITLNGTTPVSVPITATAINYMYAKTGGTTSTAVGNISLRNAITNTILYEQIAAGGNMSQSGRFTVPTGYYAKVNDCIISVQNQAIEVKIRALQSPFNLSDNARWLFKKGCKLASNTSFNFGFEGFYLSAGQSIKISGLADTVTNARVHGSIGIELIKL